MNDSFNSTYFDTTLGTTEIIEIVYQILFLIIGTPVNIVALRRNIKHYKAYRIHKRMGRVRSEYRLVRLSLHLIVANLMVVCIYCPWRTYWFINVIWKDGDILCRILSFICAFPFHLWSNLVAAIAIDMLCCVRFPLRSYHTGDHHIKSLLITSWLWAIACSVPMAIFKGAIQIPDTTYYQCYTSLNYFHGLLFNTFHAITVFYLPLIIIIGCYTWTGVALNKQLAERRQMVTLVPDPVKCSPRASFQSSSYLRRPSSRLSCGGSMEMNSISGASEMINTSPRQRHSRDSMSQHRFVRVSVTIIAVFVLSWLPYQVMSVLRLVCESFSECGNFLAKMNWTQATMIASACVNPFLYRYKPRQSEPKYATSTSTTTYTISNTKPNGRVSLTVLQEIKRSTGSPSKLHTEKENPIERTRSRSLSTANYKQLHKNVI